MAPLTISKLARRFGLSRSTLLYYDSTGLLRPSSRTQAGYRLYDGEDQQRLEQICRYREAGVALADIGELLDTEGGRTEQVLERRLEELNNEMARLREQQRVVVRLLRGRTHFGSTRTMDKARWVALLRASGLQDADMDRWHVEFERMSPHAHQDFLESLGIAPAEVERIRRDSRAGCRRD